jgi:hypothetical protein
LLQQRKGEEGGLMLKYFLMSLVLFTSIFGHWHWGGNEPKKGQLIMFSLRDSGDNDVSKVMMMTHYDPKTMKPMIRPRGWWDVNKENLWEWVYQNYTIYYIPRSSVTYYWEDSGNSRLYNCLDDSNNWED